MGTAHTLEHGSWPSQRVREARLSQQSSRISVGQARSRKETGAGSKGSDNITKTRACLPGQTSYLYGRFGKLPSGYDRGRWLRICLLLMLLPGFLGLLQHHGDPPRELCKMKPAKVNRDGVEVEALSAQDGEGSRDDRSNRSQTPRRWSKPKRRIIDAKPSPGRPGQENLIRSSSQAGQIWEISSGGMLLIHRSPSWAGGSWEADPDSWSDGYVGI